MNKPPIVLIHGLWMTPRSFEGWTDRFRAAGHEVIAPAWPGMDVEVEALRDDPSPIASLTVTKIIDHYERIIRGLDQAPIIMGHSFGGAFTQILVDRGLGCAGVAIDPAAVKGVTKLPWSTLRTGWPILRSPLNKKRAVAISLKQFQYRFTNHLDLEASRPIYERYCVPGCGHVLFEGASANFSSKAATRVDFANADRAPLLMIAGGADHVSPRSLVAASYAKYAKSTVVTDFQEYPGRVHFTIGQEGWESVAEQALAWAMVQVSNPVDLASVVDSRPAAATTNHN